ncbi:MAG TPA: hypothetical protein PK812_08445 [Beijerinckiaceae bacterium]|nr:hypothetical protein [Beijerinckiaceae bacterium]
MARRLLLRLQWNLFCLAVLLLASSLDVLPSAEAASLRPPSTQRLRACIVPQQPELTPIFAKPPVAANDDEDDDDEDDDDDDDDEDDEDFDEEAVRGWLAPDGVTCIAFGGSINAGVTSDSFALQKRGVARLRGQDVITFPLTSTARLDAMTNADGWNIATGLTIARRSGDDFVLDRATISVGPLKVGRDVSTFVFFDGADFAFSARTPARQATMLAYTLQLTETLSATASAENPPDAATALAAGAATATGARWPDLIGRVLYEGDTLTLHASGALRELRRADGRPTRLASAFLLGASRDFTIGSVTHTLLAQAGGTLGGPVFIGSQLDSTDALNLLTGGEIANGWSALTSLTSAWTDKVSTSAYASRYALRVPSRTSTTGLIDVSRYAMNVVWKPALMVKVGLEVGWSHSDITLPRIAMNGASTQRTTATIWLQKSF